MIDSPLIATRDADRKQAAFLSLYDWSLQSWLCDFLRKHLSSCAGTIHFKLRAGHGRIAVGCLLVRYSAWLIQPAVPRAPMNAQIANDFDILNLLFFQCRFGFRPETLPRTLVVKIDEGVARVYWTLVQ